MATIGVLSPAAWGHLNPMCSLGRELARRGHRVVFANMLDVEPAVLAAGLEFRPIGWKDHPAGSMDQFNTELGRLRGARAVLYSIRTMMKYGRMILFGSRTPLPEPGASAKPPMSSKASSRPVSRSWHP